MIFNSFPFLVFFPVVAVLFFVLPIRWRPLFLLTASCVFYMAFVPVYILVLGLTIGVDYLAGLGIASAAGKSRKLLLTASIIVNVGVLAAFKYYTFFNEILAGALRWIHIDYHFVHLGWILPVGLSFHTFQSMAYTIEVYRKNCPPERSFLRLALYVMFFPQLVAGPIERPQHLLPQFCRVQHFDYERIVRGLQLMLWGFFKKTVIADSIAPLVQAAYDKPEMHSGATLLAATYLFSLQIYCDFAAYSDIARGAARVLGFELMENFKRPYFAASLSNFWQRWHISLSTWFRDFVYVPLGGSRGSLRRYCFNLMIVFAVSGLWHGADWKFIAWGLSNGVFLVMEALYRRFVSPRWTLSLFPASAGRVIRSLLVFNLISITWVFFRADSLPSAILILGRIASGFLEPVAFGIPFPATILAISVAILFVAEACQERGFTGDMVRRVAPVYRWALYYAALTLILGFGNFSDARTFIYFQF